MRLYTLIRTLFFAVLISILTPNLTMAQMDIDEVPRAVRTRKPVEIVIPEKTVNVDFASAARDRYEKMELRKSRNTLTMSSTISGNMTSMSEAWQDVAGGNNTFTALASYTLKHIYTKDLFKIQTDVTAKIGYTRITYEEEQDDGTTEKDPVWYKNNDQFVISVNPSMQLANKWSYGVTVKLTSQFTEGFVSSVKQERYNLKSDFMSPGYLTISGDMIYTGTNEKWPVVVTIAPIALSATYVLNDSIIENAQYSYGEHLESSKLTYAEAYTVGPMSNSKYLGGSSLKLSMTKTFGKSKNVTYVGSIYSFYGWISLVTYKNPYTNLNEYNEAITEWTALDEKDNDKPMYIEDPTMQWENKLTLKATKVLTTTITNSVYYSKSDNLKVRTKTLLSVNFSFSYKNK